MGVIAVALFAIATVLALRVLDIDDFIFEVVIGTLVMVTSCAATTLTFWYCAPDYALAMSFSVLYVYFVKKEEPKRNFATACSMMILALSLYQAYLDMAAVLCLSILLLMLINGEAINNVIRKAFYMIGSSVTGGVMYYIILQVALKLSHLEMEAYGGVDSLGETSILDIKIAISYQEFVSRLLGYGKIKVSQFYRNKFYFIAAAVVAIMAIVIIGVKKKYYKEPIRVVVMLGLMVLFPLTCGVALFVAKNMGMTGLMVQPYYIIFPLMGAIVISLRRYLDKDKIRLLITGIFVVSVSLFAFELFTVNQATYEYNNLKHENVINSAERVLIQAESIDGYSESSDFCFAGRLVLSYQPDSYLANMAYSDFCGWSSNEYRFNNMILKNIYVDDLGSSINLCDGKKYKKLISSDEFKCMPVYPANGSIRIIDNTVLVKLVEKPSMPKETDLLSE